MRLWMKNRDRKKTPTPNPDTQMCVCVCVCVRITNHVSLGTLRKKQFASKNLAERITKKNIAKKEANFIAINLCWIKNWLNF